MYNALMISMGFLSKRQDVFWHGVIAMLLFMFSWHWFFSAVVVGVSVAELLKARYEKEWHIYFVLLLGFFTIFTAFLNHYSSIKVDEWISWGGYDEVSMGLFMLMWLLAGCPLSLMPLIILICVKHY